MRKPVVDYRQFRFSRLNTPQFSHLWLLLGWVIYFALYFITENLIPPEACHVIHHPLDDLIPFCEYFILPYVFWYVLVVITLLYFLLYNPQGFRKFQTYIIITQIAAMTVYILWPSRQDLRPESFPRDNIFTTFVSWLYTFDTNTGVFPSLHVAYSLGIASIWLKEKGVSPWWKTFVVAAVILICLSVAFIKQHSVWDIIGAFPVCIAAELLLFWDYYKNKRKSRLS